MLAQVGLVIQAIVPEACVPALAATSPDACALPQGPKKSVHPASPDSALGEGPNRTVRNIMHQHAHAPYDDAPDNTKNSEEGSGQRDS